MGHGRDLVAILLCADLNSGSSHSVAGTNQCLNFFIIFSLNMNNISNILLNIVILSN